MSSSVALPRRCSSQELPTIDTKSVRGETAGGCGGGVMHGEYTVRKRSFLQKPSLPRRWLAVIERLLTHEKDDEETRLRKLVLGITSVVFLIVTGIVAALVLTGAGAAGLWWVGMGFGALVCAVTLVAMKATGKMTENMVLASVAGALIALAIIDLHAAPSSMPRPYTMLILLLDVLLVCHVSDSKVLVILIVACVWGVVIQLESVLRFGLFDVWGTPAVAARLDAHCTCATPPCTISVDESTGVFAASVGTLLADFLVTRGFARRAEEGRERILASIDAANDVASALAKFDLDAADKVLKYTHKEMPEGLHDAFIHLLSNLRSYRPFLPPSMLVAQYAASTPAHSNPTIPGVSSPNAAICFSDIRQSTRLWEVSPHNMKRALHIHNEIIREVLLMNEGYEVKTIGDAFMMAFHTANAACEFALEVQRLFLSEVRWPQGLSRGAGNSDGVDILAIRMGVHWGAVEADRSFLTGRYDYFGSTVNKAARVEALGAAGAVTITQEVCGEIATDLCLLDRTVVLTYPDTVEARGFDAPLNLTALLHESVAGTRRSMVETQILHIVQTKTKQRNANLLEEAVEGSQMSARETYSVNTRNGNTPSLTRDARSASESQPKFSVMFPESQNPTSDRAPWSVDTKPLGASDTSSVGSFNISEASHPFFCKSAPGRPLNTAQVLPVTIGHLQVCAKFPIVCLRRERDTTTTNTNDKTEFSEKSQQNSGASRDASSRPAAGSRHLSPDAVINQVGDALDMILSTLERTRGVVDGVCNASVRVTWGSVNTHRPQQHIHDALRCMNLFYRPLDDATRAWDDHLHDVQIYSGLASGHAVVGQIIGTLSSQKFVTQMGFLMDLGYHLCAGAVQLDTHALLACTMKRTPPALSGSIRPVDTWCMTCCREGGFGRALHACTHPVLFFPPGNAGRDVDSLDDRQESRSRHSRASMGAIEAVYEMHEHHLRVHQLNLSAITPHVGSPMHTVRRPDALNTETAVTDTSPLPPRPQNDAWGQAWVEAFAAKRVDLLRQLDPDDGVVEGVCQLLESGMHLSGAAVLSMHL